MKLNTIVFKTNKELFILGPFYVRDFYHKNTHFKWSVGLSLGFYVIYLGVKKEKQNAWLTRILDDCTEERIKGKNVK